MNEYMDWTPIEMKMLRNINYDETWAEMLDTDLEEFDAWEDEID
jgi:hypothetical protein